MCLLTRERGLRLLWWWGVQGRAMVTHEAISAKSSKGRADRKSLCCCVEVIFREYFGDLVGTGKFKKHAICVLGAVSLPAMTMLH